MDTTPYLGGDWQWVDDPRAVTYFVRTAAAAPTTGGAAVESAWRTAIERADLAVLGGLAQSSGVVWHLWLARLGTIRPKIGDVVRGDDGTRWTVKLVKTCDEGERFRCVCEREN